MDTTKKLDNEEDPGACAAWCVSEFHSDNISLDHDRPVDFVTSQWPIRPAVYAVYRLLVSLTLVIWCCGDILYEGHEFYPGQAWRWALFASNWSFALLALSALWQAVTACLYLIRPHWVMDPVYHRHMPTVLKLQWLLITLSHSSALVVTTAYWGFIAYVEDVPLLTSDMSRAKHTANTVYVLCDVIMSATPTRLYHVVFSVILGSVYTVFNAMYYLNHGSLIMGLGVEIAGRDYYFMNWSQPVEAICTCVLGVFLSILAQLFLHLLYKLRLYLSTRYSRGYGSNDSELQNIVTASSSYNSLEEAYGAGVNDLR